MSDTQNQTAPAAEAAPAVEEAQFDAHLVRGNRYVLGGVHYQRGEPKTVSESVMKKLKERAVDLVTIGDSYDENGDAEQEERQKFRFTPVGDAAAAPTAPAAPRRRRAA
jgi:hypothetical protein